MASQWKRSVGAHISTISARAFSIVHVATAVSARCASSFSTHDTTSSACETSSRLLQLPDAVSHDGRPTLPDRRWDKGLHGERDGNYSVYRISKTIQQVVTSLGCVSINSSTTPKGVALPQGKHNETDKLRQASAQTHTQSRPALSPRRGGALRGGHPGAPLSPIASSILTTPPAGTLQTDHRQRDGDRPLAHQTVESRLTLLRHEPILISSWSESIIAPRLG